MFRSSLKLFTYWNYRWNMPDCQFKMERSFGKTGDHAYLWLCFEPFPQRYGLHKIIFVLNDYDLFFSLWFLKTNQIWFMPQEHLPKHLTLLAMSLPKPLLKLTWIITRSLGIIYFRWLFALPCLNLSEP